MKVFRVLLGSVGVTHVEADRYEQDGLVRFYREDTVIAEYPLSLVKEVTETGLDPGDGSLFAAVAED